MELKNFITNLNSNFTNILNKFKKPPYIDHYANILKQNGYTAIKYTNDMLLVLTQDINYWHEIEFYKGDIYINTCNNRRYITIYSSNTLHFRFIKYIKEYEAESILQLNKQNYNWNQLVSRFEDYYDSAKNDPNYFVNSHIKYKYEYIIRFLKNIYITELILYFNEDLMLIIVNYLL